jgi:flagellar basal-body rod protein FlgB
LAWLLPELPAPAAKFEVIMPFSIDSVLGPLPEALSLRSRRTEILASNLANQDTPGYKARDIDFRAAMQTAGAEQLSLTRTHAAHQAGADELPEGAALKYRHPLQASIDGNTVDAQMEQAAFGENAVSYQATLSFLSGRIKGLMLAIKGE